MWLYYWETYGVNKALSLFLQSYIKDKSHVKNAIPSPEFMEAVIRGKLNYLSMVKGRENTTYLKLKERLDKLMKTDEQQIQKLSIDFKLDKFVNSNFNFEQL